MASLVPIQAEFLIAATKLIQHATNLGFQVTGGELYRTREQQEIYIRQGLSKTMNSFHLQRLAIDLNFFWQNQLTYDLVLLRPVGEFWESLHPNHRAGMFWKFKDVPHFERRA